MYRLMKLIAVAWQLLSRSSVSLAHTQTVRASCDGRQGAMLLRALAKKRSWRPVQQCEFARQLEGVEGLALRLSWDVGQPRSAIRMFQRLQRAKRERKEEGEGGIEMEAGMLVATLRGHAQMRICALLGWPLLARNDASTPQIQDRAFSLVDPTWYSVLTFQLESLYSENCLSHPNSWD